MNGLPAADASSRQRDEMNGRSISSEPNRYHEAGDNQDAAQEEGNNDRQSAKSATQPSHLSPTVFALPNLPIAGQSASSLMDAVFGDHVKSSAPHTSQPNPQPSGGIPYTSTHSIARPPILFKRKSKRDASGASSTRTASGTETESWDVLSDAGSRMNEDAGQGEMRDGVVELKKRDEVVDELQKKVDRRKSQLPQLESELALLEAQIKAAEERLARVQVTQPDNGQMSA